MKLFLLHNVRSQSLSQQSAQQSIHVIHKFYALHQHKVFFRGVSLFVRRKGHARFRSVFYSYQVTV